VFILTVCLHCSNFKYSIICLAALKQLLLLNIMIDIVKFSFNYAYLVCGCHSNVCKRPSLAITIWPKLLSLVVRPFE